MTHCLMASTLPNSIVVVGANARRQQPILEGGAVGAARFGQQEGLVA